MELTAPAGGTCAGKPCWTTIVGRRVRYRDQEATPSGVVRMVLGRFSDRLADIVVRAKGANVPLPAMPLAEPVVAQLIRSDGPECWETTYSAADVNDDERFVARNDVDGSATFSLLRELIARGWHGFALGGGGWISGVRTSSADHGSVPRGDATRTSTTLHELSGHGGLDGAHSRGALALDDPRSGSQVPRKHHCRAGG
jgi:hypothetical protein